MTSLQAKERMLIELHREVAVDRATSGTRRGSNPHPFHADPDDPRAPKPGTTLVRKHKGVVYRVTYLGPYRWRWRGRLYPTASAVAKVICDGVETNGWVFFGLDSPRRRQGGGR